LKLFAFIELHEEQGDQIGANFRNFDNCFLREILYRTLVQEGINSEFVFNLTLGAILRCSNATFRIAKLFKKHPDKTLMSNAACTYTYKISKPISLILSRTKTLSYCWSRFYDCVNRFGRNLKGVLVQNKIFNLTTFRTKISADYD
jgi:hypothetical protein